MPFFNIAKAILQVEAYSKQLYLHWSDDCWGFKWWLAWKLSIYLIWQHWSWQWFTWLQEWREKKSNFENVSQTLTYTRVCVCEHAHEWLCHAPCSFQAMLHPRSVCIIAEVGSGVPLISNQLCYVNQASTYNLDLISASYLSRTGSPGLWIWEPWTLPEALNCLLPLLNPLAAGSAILKSGGKVQFNITKISW